MTGQYCSDHSDLVEDMGFVKGKVDTICKTQLPELVKSVNKLSDRLNYILIAILLAAFGYILKTLSTWASGS